MFLNVVYHLKFIYFLEFFLQAIILYNFIQFTRQANFYYLLSYFFLLILFLGIILIFYDFDVIAFIMWILYGGVIVVFFVYSMAWFDNVKPINFNLKSRFLNYLMFSLMFILVICSVSVDNSIEFYPINTLNYSLIDYYQYLNIDIIEDLELLGWGIIYYSSFILLVLSYFLLIVCSCVVVLISMCKKIRNKSLDESYIYLIKSNTSYSISSFKTQIFFMQEYESIYQSHTLVKNFKVTAMFHKISLESL